VKSDLLDIVLVCAIWTLVFVLIAFNIHL